MHVEDHLSDEFKRDQEAVVKFLWRLVRYSSARSRSAIRRQEVEDCFVTWITTQRRYLHLLGRLE